MLNKYSINFEYLSVVKSILSLEVTRCVVTYSTNKHLHREGTFENSCIYQIQRNIVVTNMVISISHK